MFENDLYTILHTDLAEGKSAFTAVIHLNEEHPLFRGHFPGNPILPGVCTLQIIRELLEKAEQKPLRMERSATIKYLGFIVPSVMPEVVFNLQRAVWENGSLSCSAVVTAHEASVCSFKGSFTVFPESASHSGQAGFPPASPNR
jgi:3-hydroxyacyl-[acyl-carrier-protein] dehydratase